MLGAIAGPESYKDQSHTPRKEKHEEGPWVTEDVSVH